MNTLKYCAIIYIACLVLITSCKEEDYFYEPINTKAMENDYPAIVSGNGIYDEETSPVPTILGNVRVNPYTVANMKQAWNNLNPNSQIVAISPTQLYVKFSPTGEGDYKLLANTNEMFYDYPLENELVTLGDYFPQPGREFPELWAIVPPNFQSPIAGYTIIDELFIPRYNTHLTQEAFRITGNQYDTGGDPMYIPTDNDIHNLVAPRVPEDGGGGGPGGGSGGGSGNGGGDPDFTTNACGCVVYSDNRKPGGCVQVKDSEHNRFEGVKRVKIITKDTWFTEDETNTDENGCWKINDRYHGSMWMWVKFTGPVCQIRGVKDGLNYVLGWSHPMKDYLGKIRSGPPYNNIEVKYDIWQNRGSQAHMHWAASTINNAIHDFHGYANSEGINLPKWLDIFVVSNRTDGITLMANHCPISLLNLPGIGLIPSFLLSQLPDISIGADYINSDQLKQLCYHETAHASHYTKAGCGFWTELMLAELNGIVFHNQNPYHQVDGIVNIAKAWAYHVGWFFADKNYQDPQRSIEWSDFLEFFRNRESGHMPCGVFHDLKDLVQNGIEYTSDLCCGGNYPVSDNVQGYNSNQMFSLLGGNTKSPNSFYQQFKTNYGNSDPVLLQKMDDLFNSY